MNWKIIGLLLLFCFQVVLGQHPQDALKSTLISNSPDSLKLEAALSLSKHYARINLDSALYYVIKAERIIQGLKSQKHLPRVRLQKAGILLSQQDFERAELLLKENLADPKLTSQILAMTYQNLGNINIHQKKYDKATELYLDALKIFEQENDSIGIAKVTSNIGTIYSRLKNVDEAISYFEKARKHAKGDELVNLQVLANLAGIYRDQKGYDKSISIGKEALVLARKINSTVYLGVVYSNLCNSYLGAEKYDDAISSALKGIEIKQELSQNTDILFNNLGYAYLQEKVYDKAIVSLKKVSSKAPSDLRSLVYNNLSEAYGKLNDHKSAWQFAQIHKKISDSLNGIMLQERDSINFVIRSYETEKNTQALDLLNAKNELSESKIKTQRNMLWVIGLSSLFLLLLGIVLYKNQKDRQQLKAALLKHRLLRTQLNPHFLFNALNAIQAHIYSNKKEESVEYLGNFSKLMRSVLESSDRDFISVEEDTKMLNEYIHLQQLVSSSEFEYVLTIAENLDAKTIVIPPTVTQPFVENAVIHALKDSVNGKLEINYTTSENNLLVAIEDNGGGIKTETSTNNKMHRSMSTGILAERIENLRASHKYKCSISTVSSETGTKVMLTFPLRQSKM